MYNKLFTKILDSSIWMEPVSTRIVWITFLAAMDENGFVQFASIPNVAHRAVVSLEEASKAVATLEAPDANSSDPDNEGRRVERVPGGWMVLNANKYRALVTREIIKEQTKDRVRRFRDAKGGNAVKRAGNAPVTAGNAPVTQGNQSVTPSDTETDTETKPSKAVGASRRSAGASPTTDGEWLETLKSNPTYAGIDVGREFGKCAQWCQVNGKKNTRKRFTNWLNRADMPINAHSGNPTPGSTRQNFTESADNARARIIELETNPDRSWGDGIDMPLGATGVAQDPV